MILHELLLMLIPAAVILAVIAGGLFKLFDSALNLCRKTRLEKEQAKKYKAVLKILENPGSISLACRLWINIFRIGASCFIVVYLFYNIFPNMLKAYNFILVIFIFAALFGIIITLLTDALPKLISRAKPEKIAAFLLPLMKVFSVPMLPFTLPALKLASVLNSAFKTEIDDRITEDELRNVLIEGEKSGIVESKERTMVEGVFYLGDRPVAAFMTHRSEIQCLDINDSDEEIRKKAIEFRQQQCFPVVNGSPDEIVGAVYLEDIILSQSQSSLGLAASAAQLPVLRSLKKKQQSYMLREIVKKAQFVPETMSALKAFESFKQGQSNFLFVMDEYGGLAGIISIRALVEEIVGELSAPAAREEPIIKQEDGTWLADGSLNIDDAAQALSLTGISEEGDYHTLAGLILHLAGELPKVGDTFEYQGYKFKVVDKDGNRIDKLLITKIE